MRRNTLALFFRGAVVAALPLLSACSPAPFDGWIVDGGLADGGCIARCLQPGGPSTGLCKETTNSGGGATTECYRDHTGRRPDGLASIEAPEGDALGVHFAHMAHLEAASVPAFRRLRAELRAHGAPRRLLDACSRAASDEVRHARVTARLAARHGVRAPKVVLAAAKTRSLFALAVENAREGCVRESFGALLATWQAELAVDSEVRAAMKDIAVDETRHADLAWEIDSWLRTRLTADERAAVEAVRRDELLRVGERLEGHRNPEFASAIGLPPSSVARALHQAFAAEVERRVS